MRTTPEKHEAGGMFYARRPGVRVDAIDQNMADPDVWSNHAKCSSLGAERAKLLKELEPLEFEWLRRAEA